MQKASSCHNHDPKSCGAPAAPGEGGFGGKGRGRAAELLGRAAAAAELPNAARAAGALLLPADPAPRRRRQPMAGGAAASPANGKLAVTAACGRRVRARAPPHTRARPRLAALRGDIDPLKKFYTFPLPRLHCA